MRILAVSDSHGNSRALGDILSIHSSVVDLIVHLGDGEKEYNELIKPLPLKSVFVRGNCDFGSSAPELQIVEFNGRKIFCSHGYKYSVKYDLSVIKNAARAQNADIVLFGHTHNAVSQYENGLYIVNPGSVSRYSDRPSYALIDVVESGILPNIVYI